MKIKNELVAAGLIVVFASLGTATAHAGPPVQGKFLTVRSDEVGGYNFTTSDSGKLEAEILEQLKSEAIKACAGRDYSMDTPVFQGESRPFGNQDTPVYFSMSGTARVFCAN